MEKIIEALNEIVLTNQTQIKLMREELKEPRTLASAALEESKAAGRKADAAWELVTITRNQVQEEIAYLKKPIWK
jgi:hypothetical protein